MCSVSEGVVVRETRQYLKACKTKHFRWHHSTCVGEIYFFDFVNTIFIKFARGCQGVLVDQGSAAESISIIPTNQACFKQINTFLLEVQKIILLPSLEVRLFRATSSAYFPPRPPCKLPTRRDGYGRASGRAAWRADCRSVGREGGRQANGRTGGRAGGQPGERAAGRPGKRPGNWLPRRK